MTIQSENKKSIPLEKKVTMVENMTHMPKNDIPPRFQKKFGKTDNRSNLNQSLPTEFEKATMQKDENMEGPTEKDMRPILNHTLPTQLEKMTIQIENKSAPFDERSGQSEKLSMLKENNQTGKRSDQEENRSGTTERKSADKKPGPLSVSYASNTIFKDGQDASDSKLTEKSARGFINRINQGADEDLAEIFQYIGDNLTRVLADSPGCKMVTAFAKKIAKTCGKLESNFTRILLGNFDDVIQSKGGCLVLQTSLKYFSGRNRENLAEKFLEMDSEDLTKFFVYGTGAFKQALGALDDESVGLIVDAMSGLFVKLSCHVKYYMAIKELVSRVGNNDSIETIESEVECDLPEMIVNRFGRSVVCAMLENCDSLRSKIIMNLLGKVDEMATNPAGATVLATALKFGSYHEVDELIKEVCKMKQGETETPAIQLTKDDLGHKTIMIMLEVAYGRSSSLELKGALLFKQEVLYNCPTGQIILAQTKQF